MAAQPELPKKTKSELDYEESRCYDERQSEGREHEVSPAEKKFLGDLIVLSLPFSCKDSDLKEYFTSACGEMTLHEVREVFIFLNLYG